MSNSRASPSNRLNFVYSDLLMNCAVYIKRVPSSYGSRSLCQLLKDLFHDLLIKYSCCNRVMPCTSDSIWVGLARKNMSHRRGRGMKYRHIFSPDCSSHWALQCDSLEIGHLLWLYSSLKADIFFHNIHAPLSPVRSEVKNQWQNALWKLLQMYFFTQGLFCWMFSHIYSVYMYMHVSVCVCVYI